MYTYGNNALSLDVVETLTAYSDDQMYDIVQESYSSGYRKGVNDYKEYQYKAAKHKRKERLEDIKLTIGLFCGIAVPIVVMCISYVMFGY